MTCPEAAVVVDSVVVIVSLFCFVFFIKKKEKTMNNIARVLATCRYTYVPLSYVLYVCGAEEAAQAGAYSSVQSVSYVVSRLALRAMDASRVLPKTRKMHCALSCIAHHCSMACHRTNVNTIYIILLFPSFFCFF